MNLIPNAHDAALLDGVSWLASFTGTPGDDDLIGTSDADTFDISQGGKDRVKAGGGADDIIAGAGLSASDHINGGAGADWLELQGDYSAGLVMHEHTFQSIGTLVLAGAFAYDLTLADGNLGAGEILRVNINASGAVRFDASAETDGSFSFNVTNQGAQDLTSGAGDDIFYFSNIPWQAGDQVAGGAGHDELRLQPLDSGTITLDFGPGQLDSIESLIVSGFDARVEVTMSDDNVAAGQTLNVVLGSDSSFFDGSAETDGSFVVRGGDLTSELIGGQGDDTLQSGPGGGIPASGLFTGNGGADQLIGTVDFSNRYIYLALTDSTPDAPDLITRIQPGDTIDLSAIDANSHKIGDQHFHLVDHLDGHRAQLALTYDAGTNQTRIEGDVDGDGQADLVILASGDHSDFTGFVL